MNKQQTITACEGFRQAVMLAVNTIPADDELRASIIIRFQTFYLTVIEDLLAAPTPPDDPTP
jgi:hypothetical protein